MQTGGVESAAVRLFESFQSCTAAAERCVCEESGAKCYKESPDSKTDVYQKNRTESELPCENYNNIVKVKGMPKSCAGGELGYSFRSEMFSVLDDFYAGDMSLEDVFQQVKRMCADMRVELVQQRCTTGHDAADNGQILTDLYTLMLSVNAGASFAACSSVGAKIAEQYGGVERYDWMYYDSDYYYQSEEIKGIIRLALDELSEEWGTERVDYEREESDILKHPSGGIDFNSMWQDKASSHKVACMTDLKAVPPKDFSFFFQASKNRKWDRNNLLESQKGYIEIRNKNQTWQSDVFFDIFRREEVMFYHMDDFAERFLLGYKDMGEECRGFLARFDIFKITYAVQNGDKIWDSR